VDRWTGKIVFDHLHSETVSTVRAIQDQVIATRVIEARVMHKSVLTLLCRVCGQAEETIVHLLAACPVLALTAYLYRHNLVAAVIHWHLSKVYSLPLSGGSWFTHQPLPVVEGSSAKLLWDFSLASDYKHSANRPDIVLFDYQQQNIFFVEASCPADINVTVKEDEKLNKYTLKCKLFTPDVQYASYYHTCGSGLNWNCFKTLFVFFKENPRVFNATL